MRTRLIILSLMPPILAAGATVAAGVPWWGVVAATLAADFTGDTLLLLALRRKARKAR